MLFTFATSSYKSVLDRFKGDEEDVEKNDVIVTYTLQNWIIFVIEVVATILAITLSWTCKANQALDMQWRLLYVFLAFVFSIFYLLFYVIFWQSTCRA